MDKNVAQWSVYRSWNRPRQRALAGANADVYALLRFRGGVNGTTAGAHNTGSTCCASVPPEDVDFMRSIAALMKKLADSQFAGRTGARPGRSSTTTQFPGYVGRKFGRELRALN